MNPNFSDGLLLWMEKLFYLWKMFFFHIALSSSHESFNGVTPSSGSKIGGGFMGHFIRWGNRSLIFIDLYRQPFSERLARTWNVCPLYVNVLSFSISISLK
jgi:hypothetical protein